MDDEVLFGGAAGGSKSCSIVVFPLRFISNGFFRGIIFRQRLTDLGGLKDETFRWYPATGGEWHEQQKTWKWPSGAQVRLAAIERFEDVLKYQGHQYQYIAWDELTHWKDDKAYVYMLSRLRAPTEANLRCFCRATTNPGGPGEKWVRERFRIRNPQDMHAGTRFSVLEKKTNEDGTEHVFTSVRRFIPAKIKDNPSIDRLAYEKQLMALGAEKRRQLMQGIWGVAEGVLFPEWDDLAHTCRPFPIPSAWKRWRGGDDGFSAPSAILWFAEDPDSKTLYVYHELYEKGLHAEPLAGRILDIDREVTRVQWLPQEIEAAMRSGQPHPTLYPLDGIYDSSGFFSAGHAAPGQARAEVMNRLGCKWQPCTKGPGSIKQGVLQLRELLRKGASGRPRLVIFNHCSNIIDQMSGLLGKPGEPDDLAPDQEDHAFDALRYGLQFSAPVTRVVKVAWRG